MSDLPPINVAISNTIIDEHLPAGTVLGTLSASDPEGGSVTFEARNYNYKFAPGYTEDYWFAVDGDKVVTKGVLDAHQDFWIWSPTYVRNTLWIAAIDQNGNETIFSFEYKINDLVDMRPGTDGNDYLSGTLGPDLFTGGGGNDSLSGSAGYDIAAFSGVATDYTVTFDSDHYTIRDNVQGRDGIDALWEIEALQFADKTIAIGDFPLGSAPNDITLSSSRVKENLVQGQAVGALSAHDPDGDAVTFSLVGGSDKFYIDGDTLFTNAALDFERNAEEHVGIQVTDAAGHTFQKNFTILVVDAIDVLIGTSKSDRLSGASGTDHIFGGKGNDRINGNEGADKIEGGLGRDILTGGSGKDVLVYRTVKDSTAGATGRDTITDFNYKQHDRIDLRLLDANTHKAGNQVFHFIGEEKFHGVAGELRYDRKNFDTYIYADVNGDGKADFSIHLDQSTPVQKDFFFL